MKKLIMIAAAALCLAASAFAQPKAIGLRGGLLFGGAAQVSYEHWINDPDFLEVDLGINTNRYGNGFDLIGTYNWMFARPDWTAQGDWGIYAGAGASLGSYYYFDTVEKTSAYLGLVAQVGMEYTFWFPLQLAVDIRPILGLGAHGLCTWFSPTLAVRYAF